MAEKCDACKSTGQKLETLVRDGVLLRVCVDPTECRVAAEKKGIWK